MTEENTNLEPQLKDAKVTVECLARIAMYVDAAIRRGAYQASEVGDIGRDWTELNTFCETHFHNMKVMEEAKNKSLEKSNGPSEETIQEKVEDVVVEEKSKRKSKKKTGE